MKRSVALFALIVTVGLCGCQNTASNEPVKMAMSVAEVEAKIKQIENDPKMPASAKSGALAPLQRERELAVKREAGKK